MFAIVCKCPEATWYVPEKFNNLGGYPDSPINAKRFPDEASAFEYMREHHYDTNQWNHWIVVPI